MLFGNYVEIELPLLQHAKNKVIPSDNVFKCKCTGYILDVKFLDIVHCRQRGKYTIDIALTLQIHEIILLWRLQKIEI